MSMVRRTLLNVTNTPERRAYVRHQSLPVLALCSILMAQALALAAHVVDHTPVGPIAQGLTLFAYLSLLAGVLLLPTVSLPRVSRNRIIVDAVMTTVAVASFTWYFVAGPVLLRAHHPMTTNLVSNRYLFLDLALLFAVVLRSAQLRTTVRRRTVPLLGLAAAAIIVVDLAVAYQAMHRGATAGAVPDLARLCGFMLVAVALSTPGALAQRATSDDLSTLLAPSLLIRGIPSAWRYVLPYSLVPAVVALMVFVASMHTDPRLAIGVYGMGAFLIELIFVHQFLAYGELIAYSNKSERYASLAAADPVTGLSNHRTAVMMLDRELENARLHDHPCSLLFLDLDHFKIINDRFGHRAGDNALQEFSAVVRSVLREQDTLGRWGGEEFVALLPEMDAEHSLLVAERIRLTIDERLFHAVGGGHLTCSIGVASYPLDARDRDTLIERADQAMYTAKHSGRNRVCLVQDDGTGYPESSSKIG